MTSVSALRFTFPSSSSSSSRGPPAVLYDLVQLGCDASLLSLQWVRNHYRWIVWKLAGLERSFPSVLAGRCLTYYQLVKQMRHRYEREMERAQRSALTLILERDDSAARYLVLCVAAIFPSAAAADAAEPLHDKADGGHADGDEDEDVSLLLHREQQRASHVELTDGWYSVAARLDAGLLEQLRRGRIRSGSKLRIFNAALGGGSDGASPLENSSLHLELHSNSTRRAPAHYRLGFQRSAVFSVCLASLREDGGVVPCLQAVVGRVYPLLWMERTEDGRKIHRTQRAEDAAQEEWAQGMISRAEEQQAAAARAAAARGDELSSTLAESSFAAEEEPLPRTVFPYLKVRLHELVPAEAAPPLAEGEELGPGKTPRLLSGSECLLTVWKPSEADTAALREGSAITVFAAQMSGRYDGLLRLSSSRFAPILSHPALPPFLSLQRRATAFSQLSLLRAGDEFDAVMVTLVERRFLAPAAGSERELQQTRQLFGCYDAEAALLVEVREDAGAQRHFASLTAPLQLPLVLLALNLRYVRHDAAHRLHVAHATLSSAFSTKGAGGEGGSRQRLARDWANCKAWAETAAAQEVERLQRQRLQRLVDGEQEATTDGQRELWFAELRRRIADTAATV